MKRLPTEGEMPSNDMAVSPVGKAARATVNKTVWGGAGKSAICSASIPKCQPFGKKKAAIFATAIGVEVGMYDGFTIQNKTWFLPVSQSASCATARRYGYSATRLWSACAAAFS